MLAINFTKFLTLFFFKKASFSRSLNHSSLSWEITLLYFSSWNLYAIDKRNLSKCKFLDIQLLPLKLTKFLLSIFKAKVSSSPHFASFFSLMTHNSSIPFCFSHNILLIKVAHQGESFQTCHCPHQNSLNSSCYFWNQKVSFSSNFALLFIVMRQKLFCTFSSKIYMRWTKRAH